MFLVGLTGGIASGKSTSSNMFKRLKCAVVDADVIARQVVEPGQHAYKALRAQFGEDFFLEDGSLNREQLGDLIFSNPDKRKMLNAIVHPAIKKQMLWEIFLCFMKGYQFIILDIPLLFETKQMLPYLAYTIVVHCNETQQLDRLMERNKLSKDEAEARISSQMPLSEKCKLASFQIDNSESIEFMQRQVERIHEKLQSSKRHLLLRYSAFVIVAGIVTGLILLCKNVLL